MHEYDLNIEIILVVTLRVGSSSPHDAPYDARCLCISDVGHVTYMLYMVLFCIAYTLCYVGNTCTI